MILTLVLLRSLVGVDLWVKRIVEMTARSHTQIYRAIYSQAIFKGVLHHPWQLSEQAKNSRWPQGHLREPQTPTNVRSDNICVLPKVPLGVSRILLTIPCLSPTNSICYVLCLYYACKARHYYHQKFNTHTETHTVKEN